MRLAQGEADVGVQGFDLVLQRLIELHLFQNGRAAPQIKSQAHRTGRQPVRQPLENVGRDRIGQRDDNACKQDQPDQHADPCGNLEHNQSLSPLSLAGWFFGRTSLIVLLSTLVCTPSAISTVTCSSSAFTGLETVAMWPPAVITVSPRRMFAMAVRSCFARCCCGRISMKYMTT